MASRVRVGFRFEDRNINPGLGTVGNFHPFEVDGLGRLVVGTETSGHRQKTGDYSEGAEFDENLA